MRLEIGFGGGEHLMRRAAGRPAAGFIGVEPFVNGMAKLMHARCTRLRAAMSGSTATMRSGSSTGCRRARSTRIDLLYPDPWPKKRHWKRRFVGEANLDRFARVMKPGGRSVSPPISTAT